MPKKAFFRPIGHNRDGSVAAVRRTADPAAAQGGKDQRQGLNGAKTQNRPQITRITPDFQDPPETKIREIRRNSVADAFLTLALPIFVVALTD